MLLNLRFTEIAGSPDTGEILGVRVADLGEKDGLVAAEPDVFFTIPHLDGWPAVLVRYGADRDRVALLLRRAWWDRASVRERREVGERP